MQLGTWVNSNKQLLSEHFVSYSVGLKQKCDWEINKSITFFLILDRIVFLTISKFQLSSISVSHLNVQTVRDQVLNIYKNLFTLYTQTQRAYIHKKKVVYTHQALASETLKRSMSSGWSINKATRLLGMFHVRAHLLCSRRDAEWWGWVWNGRAGLCVHILQFDSSAFSATVSYKSQHSYSSVTEVVLWESLTNGFIKYSTLKALTLLDIKDHWGCFRFVRKVRPQLLSSRSWVNILLFYIMSDFFFSGKKVFF